MNILELLKQSRKDCWSISCLKCYYREHNLCACQFGKINARIYQFKRK